MPTEKRQRQKEGHRLHREELKKWERRRANRRRLMIWGGAIVVLFGGAFLLSTLQGDDDAGDAAPATTTTTVAPTECPPADAVAGPVLTFAAPPPTCIDPAREYAAVFATSEGEIRVDLDTENTPDTVNNFVVLARYGYYDGTPIFRTNTGIDIIQGGGQDNSASPGYTIPDEGDGYTYEAGQLVMARTPAPDSAGGQFFFVGGPGAASLDADGTYVVFGQTDGPGLEVVQAILDLHEPAPGGDPSEGAPGQPVTITSVTIEET